MQGACGTCLPVSSTQVVDKQAERFAHPLYVEQQSTEQQRTTVLSSIRDIVSAPDFTPPSVASAVNACAATLPAAEFSDLLKTPNIAGHTALYWAIVNNRQEAFSALAGFISQFSSVCSSDLRLACLVTSDQALFTAEFRNY